MWTSILSGLGIVGSAIGTVFGYLDKKADVGLAKYVIDGQVNQKLVDADVALTKAQAELIQSQNQFKGYRYLHYLFGYPLGIYFALVIADAITEKIPGWENTWDVMSINPTITQWSTWIVGGLFLHASIPSKWR